jgi:hypothetical protein
MSECGITNSRQWECHNIDASQSFTEVEKEEETPTRAQYHNLA